MPKWDNSVVRMSKLNPFLQQVLKEIYSQHLAEKMTECVRCFCYGCMHAKDNKVMHNLCSLHVSDRVRFCIYFALDFVDEAAILEQYGNDVGLAAFEWLDIFDPDYRHSTWIGGEEWITDVTHLVLDKWTSQWLSSCGGRSSVLLMFEYMWWKDMSFTEGWASPPCLNCVGWQDMSLTVVRKIERPPLILTVLVVGQELISIILPRRPPLILTV